MSDPASLDNLHGIIVPAPVPWWPPAPGWYLLAAVIAVFAALGTVRALRRRRAEAYRRAALAEFAAIADRVGGGAPDADGAALGELPALLKRTAMAAFHRERVARLSGPRWWAFLDATSGGSAFADGAGPALDRLAYGVAASLDAGERRTLLAAAGTWLRRHRRDAVPPPC